MNEPDLEALQGLCDELFVLGDAGKLTRAQFDRLWAEMVEAAHGHDEALEGIEMSAQRFGVELGHTTKR